MLDKSQKLPIVNLHLCIQGEGQSTGTPMILVRLSKCNLNCIFKGSICDSSETSWDHNPSKNSLYSLQDIEDLIKAHTHIKTMMITGGNPTYSPEIFKAVVGLAKECGLKVEIEDNGTTYLPMKSGMIDLITISPKLSNSIPRAGAWIPELNRRVTPLEQINHDNRRKNYDSMRKWIKSTNYQLKFVISDEDEVEEAIKTVIEIGADIDKVFFMPEGATRKQLESRRRWLYERCIELGVKYTDRLHVIVYDNLKGV